jgi:hypothetical protein
MISTASRPLWSSIVHLLTAAAVYWHLIKGGWLTNRYQLDDPNTVNLGLAIFEAVAVMLVIGSWISRSAFLGRLIWRLCLVQIAVAIGFLVFFLVFAATFRFKLM